MRAAAPSRTTTELWEEMLRGSVDIVASDHSPTEPSMKKDGDFRSSWGGIAGVQSTLPVLLDRGYHARQLAIERIVSSDRLGARGAFPPPQQGAD